MDLGRSVNDLLLFFFSLVFFLPLPTLLPPSPVAAAAPLTGSRMVARLEIGGF